ncbi:Fn3-like domain-containing protein [Mycena chlorophos]|uniref:beta-glucosidase n=1 Tax=Mycena chlorophos TaxID=658473 RepID=A0A8H6SM18_MYCCL|nr:Fn3-like domain-containing protein [Mycena chlorophos]
MVRSSSFLKHVALAILLAAGVQADLTTGIPDSAPPGYEEWISPIIVPAANVTGQGDWGPYVQRARALVATLTIEEKVNVTTGADVGERCVGNTGTVERIGWKGLCLEDSPLGVRFADFASAFPAGINVAMTWDVDLIKARGLAMGQEHKGKGVNVALGPMTNMGRQAAAGRQWEGFGSDPFLSGVAVTNTIDGMQSAGVIATVKHFIGNEQEHFRGGSEGFPIYSSNIDDKTMHEVYLWPFSEAIKADVGAVMCSYNLINQTQACQNSKVINGFLKQELGFQGFIMSDWAAMINGVQPALAGLDMNMPGFVQYGDSNQANPAVATNSWWGAELITMIQNGSVPESRLDDMVTRIFATYYKLGQENNYPPVSFSQLTENTYLNGQLVNEHVNVQDDHYKTIRQIGAQSAVLLKNTGSLPLSVKKLKRVGVFGSDAAPRPAGPNSCQDGTSDKGCDEGTLAMGWGSGTANFPYLIDPFAAISQHIYSIDPTVVIEGVLLDYAFAANAPVASNADTCLVFVNADSGEGYLNISGNAGDRNNITLWHGGEALIENVASQCENTIVVQHAVGAIIVESWIDHPNVTAYIQAGLPGQESGNSLVDVLFSDSPQAYNPSGRLVYTVAKQASDYPAQILYTTNVPAGYNPQITYEEGVNIDYRWFDAHNIEPRFEFGFGLSYTTFSYSNLHISSGSHWRREADHHTTTAHTTSSATSKAASSTVASSSAKASSSVATNATTSAASSISASASASASGSASVNASTTATAPTSANTTTPVINPIGGPSALYEQAASVSFTIKNTGHLSGNEIAQLYVSFPSQYAEPPRVLRGFSKVEISAGRSTSVTIPLRVKDLSVWDVVTQQWVLAQGAIGISVGSSSRNLPLSGTLHL